MTLVPPSYIGRLNESFIRCVLCGAIDSLVLRGGRVFVCSDSMKCDLRSRQRSYP